MPFIFSPNIREINIKNIWDNVNEIKPYKMPVFGNNSDLTIEEIWPTLYNGSLGEIWFETNANI